MPGVVVNAKKRKAIRNRVWMLDIVTLVSLSAALKYSY